MRLIFTILLSFIFLHGFSQVVKVDMSRAISYNHKMMGRAAALTDEQDTTVTPTACGNWYEQHVDSVRCFTGYNAPFAPDNPYLPWPAEISWDLMANYNLTAVYLYIENPLSLSADSNTIILKAGTPYTWQDAITTQTCSGNTFNRWVRVNISLGHSTRYLHLLAQKYSGIIREMVLYGTLVDTVARPAAATVKKPNTLHRIGTNFRQGDGQGRDSQTDTVVDYSVKFDNLRIYYAERYLVDSSGLNLRYNGRGLNSLDSIFADNFYDHGVNYWYTMAGMAVPSQVIPQYPDDGYLTFRKPIDWQDGAGSNYWYVLNGSGDTTNKISFFNLVDTVPQSYAHIAYTAKITAAELGGRPKPSTIFEIGNEFDGKFLGPGWFGPDAMATYCSVMYDGDEGRVTYMGQSVGVKNSGTPMLMSMPGMVDMNIEYLKVMSFHFQHKRTDHKFASDIINGHHYTNSSGTQGQNGKGQLPEHPVNGELAKVAPFKQFRDSLAPHALVMNTETGFDAFPKRVNDTTEQYCGPSIFGNSFQNVPEVAGQSILQTHGNFVARDILLNVSTDIDLTCQFVLADRIPYGTTCGTFYASGLLTLDSVVAYVPYFTPRPAYWYLKTIDRKIRGKEFVNQHLTVRGSDSIWIQKYRSVTNSDSVLYAIWSPTAKNASFDYNLTVPEVGTSTITGLNLSETGYTISTVALPTMTITVSETPVFVDVSQACVNCIRANIRFLNAP